MPVSGLRRSSVNNINNMKKLVSIGANGLFYGFVTNNGSPFKL